MIVLVIGTGLLGASAGLALVERGHEVYLRDASPHAAGLAEDLGAGRLPEGQITPDLVIVATPPDVAGDVVSAALTEFQDAIVTDVASVKEIVAAEVRTGRDRYVGSHPMAGRERSGATAADADLFVGRPWVIVPTDESSAQAVSLVRNLAISLGSLPVDMTASEHDAAVARVSHVPQLLSSLMAARLAEAPASALQLSGQGLRDVTRIAKSDPRLWSTIIAGNTEPVRDVLAELQADLTSLIAALESVDAGAGSYRGIATVAKVIDAGNEGVYRIPGKHGGAPVRYATLVVLVPDTAGELGRLFTDIGQIGVNIEDLTLEHSVNQPVGRAFLSVMPALARDLADSLGQRGWTVADTQAGEA